MHSVIEVEVCHAIRDGAAITLNEVKEMVAKCPLSQKIIELVRSGKESDDPDLKPYMAVRPQLCMIDGIVCKGRKIFIPPALQNRAVKLSHQAHQGMTKAKAFARTFCWFPGIDAAIECKVKMCPCNIVYI